MKATLLNYSANHKADRHRLKRHSGIIKSPDLTSSHWAMTTVHKDHLNPGITIQGGSSWSGVKNEVTLQID